MTMTRRLALIVPLALFIAFVVVVMSGIGRPQQQVITSKMVGQPVPPLDLPGLDAQHPGLSSADLRQGNVVLVNLFASWCLPCQVEAPYLKALADKGVVIHAVAIRDDPKDVQQFLQRHGDPFRRIGLDPQGRAQIAFGSSGVPETFVIDGKGIIRHQHIGDIRAENVPQILKIVEEARQ